MFSSLVWFDLVCVGIWTVLHKVSTSSLIGLVNGEGERAEDFYTILSISFFPHVLSWWCSCNQTEQWNSCWHSPCQSCCLSAVCTAAASCPSHFSPSMSSLDLPAVLLPNVQIFLARHKTTTRIALLAGLNEKILLLPLLFCDPVGSSESISLPTETHQALC